MNIERKKFFLTALEEQYRQLLEKYINTPDEKHLLDAYQLGRDALAAKGGSVLDFVAIHHDCLIFLLENVRREEVLSTADKAGILLEEVLAPFEMTHPGLRETLELLNKRAIDFAMRTHALRQEVADHKSAEVTIRKMNAELEERVHERTRDLEMANKELEAFSYSVSHDLRTPLQKISGFSEILMQDKKLKVDMTEKQHEYLTIIRDAALGMNQLINDLLAFSHVARFQLKKTDQNLNEVIQAAIKELNTPDIQRRKVEWQIDDSLTVYADHTMMRLMITNLLSNALKYTRPREKAVIEVKKQKGDRDEVVFYVRDNGVGFDMKEAHKLFGVFQRLHSPSVFEGTGIGLANVDRIVKRHGGRIWAESQRDQGATFYIALPNRR